MDLPDRLALLGAEADVLTSTCMLDHVAEWVATGEGGIVANHNLHSLYLYHRDPELRAFYARADLIEIDSTPIVAWGRMMGYALGHAHRSTYLDFRDEFWARAEANGWRVYHVGGAPEHVDPAREAILKRYPGVHLECRHGYFAMTGPENDAVIADITEKQPHILLVGMGMPRQELWLHQNYDRLPPLVALPIGGAFDYEAGVTYTPPRWTGDAGIEWLVRWAHDPQRLFERYFIEPWALIPHMMRDFGKKLAGRTPPPMPPAEIRSATWRRRQALSGSHTLPAPVGAQTSAIPVALQRRSGN